MESVFEEVFKLLEVRGRGREREGCSGQGPRGGHDHGSPSRPQCPHLNVRKAAHEALGQFCCALHQAGQSCPSEPSTAGERGWGLRGLRGEAGPDRGLSQ